MGTAPRIWAARWAKAIIIAAGTCALASSAAWSQTDKPLQIAVTLDPDMIDMTQSTNPPQGWATLINVYEKLVSNNPDGAIIAALAESWDISGDGKIITMHLRHGVKFSSGDAFTAADVVFSHERALAKARFYGGYARSIDHVEAVDDFTAKFVFKAADSLFLPIHPLVIASKAYFDRVGEAEFARHPVGTGPYRIVDYKPSQYLELSAWDGYWGEKPQTRHARFVFVKDDQTRIAKLRAGEADIIMDTSYAAYDELKEAGFTLIKAAVHPTQSLQLHLANPHSPWHDLRIRKAMAYAIDNSAIVNGLLHGVPYHYPRIMPGELGYDPDLPDYKYDPAMAKKLAAEAGYGDGWTMPLYYSSGLYFGTRETAEAVALYLKQNLNVTSKLQSIDLINQMQMVGKIANDPNAEYAAISGLPIANLSDPIQGITLLLYGRSPFSLYHNKDFDAVFEQAEAAIEDAKREPLIRQLMKIEQDDLPTITLWQYATVYAMKKGLSYTPGKHSLEVLYLPWVRTE